MKICVIGSGDEPFTEDIISRSMGIGKRIAYNGDELLVGGCEGYSYHAALGAKDAEGVCTAYSPARSLKEHTEDYNFPADSFDDIHYIPEGFWKDGYINLSDPNAPKQLRSFAMVFDADRGIVIGGDAGTFLEFQLLYILGKPIGVLKDSGGITDYVISFYLENIKKDRGSRIIYNHNPVSLVDGLIEL